VDEFDDSGELVVVLPLITAGARGENQEHRPQALSPTPNDVIRDLADEHHVRVQTVPDNAVYGLEVGGDECTQRVYGHSRQLFSETRGGCSIGSGSATRDAAGCG
jgi:hypothetical protein